MKILARTSHSSVATVYIAQFENNKIIEFVESTPQTSQGYEKWVLIISTLFGCPVNCKICDAGNFYSGKLSKDEIFSQIDYLVSKKYPNFYIFDKIFKIQFARMGEPSFNDAVLDVLEEIPNRYFAPKFVPSLSTIAPDGTESFFERLIHLKKELYSSTFQLQFSLHTTDTNFRDYLIPVKKWSFTKIANYGERFYDKGGKKISLNFALGTANPYEPEVLYRFFDNKKFVIKFTPINPTIKANRNNISSLSFEDNIIYDICEKTQKYGFEVIISIGDYEENNIGSNCGQYITNYLQEKTYIENAYSYELINLNSNI